MWMGIEQAMQNVIDLLKLDEDTISALFEQAEIEVVDDKETDGQQIGD